MICIYDDQQHVVEDKHRGAATFKNSPSNDILNRLSFAYQLN